MNRDYLTAFQRLCLLYGNMSDRQCKLAHPRQVKRGGLTFDPGYALRWEPTSLVHSVLKQREMSCIPHYQGEAEEFIVPNVGQKVRECKGGNLPDAYRHVGMYKPTVYLVPPYIVRLGMQQLNRRGGEEILKAKLASVLYSHGNSLVLADLDLRREENLPSLAVYVYWHRFRTFLIEERTNAPASRYIAYCLNTD